MFKFDKNNRIVVFIYENVMYYPPVLNLIECLLNNSYKVRLVSEGTKDLPEIIKNSPLFESVEIGTTEKRDIISRLRKRSIKTNSFRRELARVGDGDIVWTVNPLVVRTLGKDLKKYSDRHVMELMELTDTFPLYYKAKHLKYPVTCLVALSPLFFATLVGEESKRYFRRFISAFLSTAGYIIYVAIVYSVATQWLASIAPPTITDITSFFENMKSLLPRTIILIACCRVMTKPPKVLLSLTDGG